MRSLFASILDVKDELVSPLPAAECVERLRLETIENAGPFSWLIRSKTVIGRFGASSFALIRNSLHSKYGELRVECREEGKGTLLTCKMSFTLSAFALLAFAALVSVVFEIFQLRMLLRQDPSSISGFVIFAIGQFWLFLVVWLTYRRTRRQMTQDRSYLLEFLRSKTGG
jgi:hypothetical protein